MNTTYPLSFIIFGYSIIELVALPLCLIGSVATWNALYYSRVGYPYGGGSPGDGLVLIFLLTLEAVVWIITAIATPILAHILFPNPVIDRFKRMGFSFVTPVIVAIIVAALIGWITRA
jgi:hypothetical protein